MTYLPRFQPQLVSSDPYGSVNCACYCEAMAADYATAGKVRITGEQVRAASDEPIPRGPSKGLNLGQVNRAGIKLGAPAFEVHTNTLTALSWQAVTHAVEAGRGVHLAIWYASIRDSPYGGSDTFFANHGIAVFPGWIVMDPLADGRRPGIYKYHGAAYPPDLLRRAAGGLNIATSGYRALGRGQAFANLTPVPPSTTPAPPPQGKEEPLNATTQKPVAVCKVRSGGSLYADPDRKVRIASNWAGGDPIQLYSRPTTPSTNGKANLAAIRVDMAAGSANDLHVYYVGNDLIENVRLI